eukprot:CAMPEP_0113292246 /NCGR_PEP_ID=MMETSP0008_2-20120614/34524_1 /TAXON_ID=97485 /ORGANISM="Prymnesium parvum" /LENGTH=614 /DNA_ID=CAMNT_0000144301 /DNA_START=18 /DNA_END=1866 /DNA_ORIENTATION=+ /assembly_acc=CAM_ASM_000153
MAALTLASARELLTTEEAYVHDLEVLCALKATILTRKACDLSTADAIFANVDTLRGINSELLHALKGEEAPPDGARPAELDRISTAFLTLAPFLRAYAVFCTKAINAQERLMSLRASHASLDHACAEYGAAARQHADQAGPAAVQVPAAAQRDAQGRAGAREPAPRDRGDPRSGQRRQRAREGGGGAGGAARARGGARPPRAHHAATLAAALGRGGQVLRGARLWRECDRVGAAAPPSARRRQAGGEAAPRVAVALLRPASDGPAKGASYSLLEQSSVHHTTVETLDESCAVLLSCESGNSYLLQLLPDDARTLTDALESTRRRDARRNKTVAREAADFDHCGVGDELAKSVALQHLDDGFEETRRESEASGHKSWTMRLRLRMSSAARELSAGSFGRRKRVATNSREEEGIEEVAATRMKSRRCSDIDDPEQNVAENRGGSRHKDEVEEVYDIDDPEQNVAQLLPLGSKAVISAPPPPEEEPPLAGGGEARPLPVRAQSSSASASALMMRAKMSAHNLRMMSTRSLDLRASARESVASGRNADGVSSTRESPRESSRVQEEEFPTTAMYFVTSSVQPRRAAMSSMRTYSWLYVDVQHFVSPILVILLRMMLAT